MSFKVFLRDISNVSSARSVLLPMSPHSFSNNSPRLMTDGVASGTNTRQLDSVDTSKLDLQVPSNFEICKSIASLGSEPINPDTLQISSSKQIKCMLTPRQLKSSQSLITSETDKIYKNAGNKIFTAAILFSWRKQKEHIKELSNEVEVLKRQGLKYDHRAHVYEKMYDNEKERSYELKNKLRDSQEKLDEAREKHDSLANSYVTLQAAISLLEQQLFVREEQYDGLQLAFNDMQSSLFKSMAKERELQRQLSDELRRIQSFIVRESDLVAKMHELKKCAEYNEQNLCDQLNFKQLALIRYKQENEYLIVTVRALLVKKAEYDVVDDRLQNTINEVTNIKDSIQSLRHQLENSWDNRFRRFWRSSTKYRHRFAEILLIVVYCLFPGMPIPRTSTISLYPLRFGIC